jgi:hypothetical protein
MGAPHTRFAGVALSIVIAAMVTAPVLGKDEQPLPRGEAEKQSAAQLVIARRRPGEDRRQGRREAPGVDQAAR